MPAIPRHRTATTANGDCRGAVSQAPSERRVLRYMHAIFRGGDPDAKGSYALPHHGPSANSPARLNCVRNALARLPQTEGLSDAEREGARRHLEGHLADAERRLPTEELMPSQSIDERERRFTPVRVEIRASDDTKSIGGYAAVFNRQSKNLGGFVERIDPGAFNASRGDGWPEVIARYNHDDNMLLGTTTAGTLRLEIDGTGLDYRVSPPSAMSQVMEWVERGDVNKSSFAFRTIEDDWAVNDQGFPMRTLLRVQLVDVAPVTIPAYADTSAALRSLAESRGVDVDTVVRMVEADPAGGTELRKLFVRTDDGGQPAPVPTLGAKARMELLGKKEDPWS